MPRTPKLISPPERVDKSPKFYDWQSYRTGDKDSSGRLIEEVYAFADDFVIYFCGDDLYYECTDELLKKMGEADLAMARINRLLPFVRKKESWLPSPESAASGSEPRPHRTWQQEHNRLTLELAADALEMILCEHNVEGMVVLNGIVEKLQTTAEATRRLQYQSGALCAAAILWAFYLGAHGGPGLPEGWEPWVLAAGLGVAGGALSVCMNLGSLQINVNQKLMFLFFTGSTRAIVALLAGVACLLAMRAKVFAGIAYGDVKVYGDTILQTPEMFFCFLAGFSETFIPNILRESDNRASQSKPRTPAPADSARHGAHPDAPNGAHTGASQPQRRSRRTQPKKKAT